MKDGTELTHYGVKGMKWGKRLFGKPRSIINAVKAAKYLKAKKELDNKMNQNFKDYAANYRRGDVVGNGNGRRTTAEFSRLWQQHQTTNDLRNANRFKPYGGQSEEDKKRAKVASNKLKRYSTRLNGR